MCAVLLSKNRLIFNKNKITVFLDTSEIIYFEVLGKRITAHCVDRDVVFYCTMILLEEILEKECFLRIHRAYLINSQFISEISRKSIKLQKTISLPVGRSRLPMIRCYLDAKYTE